MASNRFFLWSLDSAAAVEFDPHQGLDGAGHTDRRYFIGIAAELDRAVPEAGVTVLVTWHLDRFEDRFRDAVVILVGDEKYQRPAYAGEVRAIFKTGGRRPNSVRATLALSPALAWRVGLRDARNRLLSLRRRRHAARAAPVFEVPMGYFGLSDVPSLPFEARDVDVFFAGSVERGSAFTLRPRLAARRQMSAALDAARARLPGLKVQYATSGPFANPGEMLGPAEYSAALMRSKIALCPRGNFDETFRLGEAAKSGCVAIAERLPARWYYQGSPVLELARWSELPDTLERLLGDPVGLAGRADTMRRWWDERLSETAVAAYVAASIGGVALG